MRILKHFKKLNIARGYKKFFILFFCLFLILIPCLAKAQDATFWTGLSNSLGGAVALLLSWIALLITALVGLMTTVFVQVLINIAQFNKIIDVQTVKIGWTTVRDICNMFFILILLVIAFGTILRIESYNAKKMLPKLLIMAVLINFSKTIFGLIIDFSQVIMLTFVYSFKDSAGLFISLFNVKGTLSGSQQLKNITNSASGWTNWALAISIIAGILASLVTFIVVIVIVAVLAIRIIMLWIYTIMSPLVFLGMALPSLQKFTSRIWDDFIKQVIIGPVLAFFIWLALTTASISSGDLTKNSGQSINVSGNLTGGQQLCITGGISDFFCDVNLQNYIIFIGLLMGGLMVAQGMGGAAGSIAGKGMGKIHTLGNVGSKIGKAGLFKAGRSLDKMQIGIQKAVWQKGLGVEKYIPKSLNYRAISQAWKANKAENLEKYDSDTGGEGAWRDTFHKYGNIKQYGAFRKSMKQRGIDKEEAARLDNETAIMQKRKNYLHFSGPERDTELKYMTENEDKIKAKYKAQKFDPEVEFEEDIKHLISDKDIDGKERLISPTKEAEYDKKIAENNEHMQKLNDEKVFGFKSAKQYDPKWYDAGNKENQLKGKKAMSERTGDESFSLVKEVLQAVDEKDGDKLFNAFQILGKNNDLNETLKDNRVIQLMAKSNGILEKLLKGSKKSDGTNYSEDEIKSVIKDFGKNPVSPAYLQAMVQGMFKEININDRKSARYAHEIGSTTFAAGNSIGYGMSAGNASTGDYEYEKLDINNVGGLKSSQGRINAINGKFSNLESQEKMRKIHPENFIKTDTGGVATGLSDEGREFVLSLTGHDMGQISRLRLDHIKKMGGNSVVLSDLKKLAKVLETNNQKEKAKMVKYFTGYLKSRAEGAGVKDDEFRKAEESFDSINEV